MRLPRRLAVVLATGLAAAATVATGAPSVASTPATRPAAQPAPSAAPSLLRAPDGSHSRGTPLDGSTLHRPEESLWVYVPDDGDIAQVRFLRDGALVQEERQAPFDLGTTAPDGSGRPFQVLTSREHTVRAVVTRRSGGTVSVQARFTLVGGEPPSLQVFTLTTGTASHADGRVLDGTALRATSSDGAPLYAYVEQSGEPNIAEVWFSVDGVRVRTEREAPWDVGGTAADGTGRPYLLAVGSHTVDAFVIAQVGTSTVVRSRVSVLPAATTAPAPAG